MPTRQHTGQRRRQYATGISLLLLASLGFNSAARSPVFAADSNLPPRAQWHASSSSTEVPAMAAAFAIDGNPKTRWGGAFSAGHWLQIDLGQPADVAGVVIHWDSGFAHAYSIQYSTDGKHWHIAFKTTDGPGGIDYAFFPRVHARYLRLASAPRTADWGVSVFEFQPLAPSDVPRIEGVSADKPGDAAALWSPGAAQTLTTKGDTPNSRVLRIQFPQPITIAGLEVFWGGARRSAQLEGRDASGKWQSLAEDPQALGDTSDLAARTAHTVTALRLTVDGDGKQPPAIRRLRLLGSPQVMTAMRRYEIAASHAHADLFPSSLHQQQVYWTVVGVPAGRQKSVFSEYGDIEAFKGAPLVQPLWRDHSGRSAAAYDKKITHSLRDGWMPMPTAQWSPQVGLNLRSEAIAVEQNGAPLTLVRHRVTNTGKQSIDGDLSLIVRPMQMSPPWQNGGLAPIHDIAVEGDAAQSDIRVNGRILFNSLTPVTLRGAEAFGAHGEHEITQHVPAGTAPKTLVAHDGDGLAAALLTYRVQLKPGEHQDIVIAMPLGNEAIDVSAAKLPDAPTIDREKLLVKTSKTTHDVAAEAGAGFDALTNQDAQQWQTRFGKIGLSLPDHSLVDMLRAQAAYMLINQTGPAMQAGPRNYNRSFIRDGSATAAALLRLGQAKTARDYLRWYADHAVHANGLVSPILNDDGTVNRGMGSDLEYDSQGEFIYLVAEIARLDGGAASVREYLPKVKLAMQFLQKLRERTLVPNYMASSVAPERFHGILAPSISHEGYSTPTHSYWDDYWALKGWHDGAWLAEQWGDAATAKWAREQYQALRISLAASIRATMKWKHIDFMPASADLGDSDPTSVSIGVDPCGQQDVMPMAALDTTFSRYLADIHKRAAPGALYSYTPYEIRNVLTFVHLDQPQHAAELLDTFLRDRRPLKWQVLAEVVYSELRHAIYLGDMPHTWIGSEYARALIGMLMREDDNRLLLLPGTPPAWIAGEGLSVTDLPTAYGKLTMTARQEKKTLRVTLGSGLRDNTALQVSWPSRLRPTHVTVDGKAMTDFTAEGIRLSRPFKTLEAQW